MAKKELRHIRGPDFTKYFVPVIEILKELGGSGNPGEITDLIIERYNISEDELELRNKNGGSTVKNRIAWARFYLVKGVVLDSTKRGVWTLRPNSVDLIDLEKPNDFFSRIHSQFEKRPVPKLEFQIPSVLMKRLRKRSKTRTIGCRSSTLSKTFLRRDLNGFVKDSFVKLAFPK